MARKHLDIAPGVALGAEEPLTVIAGPCVIENSHMCADIAHHMAGTCKKLGLTYVFKASFDKANRTSLSSFRGPGLKEGLAVLEEIKTACNVPVLTDIHDRRQAPTAADVVDVLQIPAFLCRQTDLVVAAAQTGKPVNIKKGQFMAPEDMTSVIEKAASTGNNRIMVTERGTTFGYHNLVVDMRALAVLGQLDCGVVFDATHSVQLPGAGGQASGGQREYVPALARAAAAVGIDALFLEVHPDPETALSDGPNCIPLDEIENLLSEVQRVHEASGQSSAY